MGNTQGHSTSVWQRGAFDPGTQHEILCFSLSACEAGEDRWEAGRGGLGELG